MLREKFKLLAQSEETQGQQRDDRRAMHDELLQANYRLRDEVVSEPNHEEGEVAGHVWKAYQGLLNSVNVCLR